MRKNVRREILALSALLALVLAAFWLAHSRGAFRAPVPEISEDSGVRIEGTAPIGYRAGAEAHLSVQVGGEMALIPLDSEGTITISQADGRVNTVALAAGAFHMQSANCDNQDCVHQGEVTLENRGRRVMTGFVICLPNEVVLEILDADQAAEAGIGR